MGLCRAECLRLAARIKAWLDTIPRKRPATTLLAAHGAPETDPACRDGAFRFRAVHYGKLTIALQPPRDGTPDRKAAITIPTRRRATPTSPSIWALREIGHRRPDPSRDARHDRVAAGQGGCAVARLLAAPRYWRASGGLSLCRR